MGYNTPSSGLQFNIVTQTRHSSDILTNCKSSKPFQTQVLYEHGHIHVSH